MPRQGPEIDPKAGAVTPVKPRKRASVSADSSTVPKKAPVAKKSKAVTPPTVEIAAALSIASQDIAREDIAKLAYLLWESRGYSGGSPDEDWYTAEAQLRELTQNNS